MARSVAMTYPLDQPILTAPGLVHREADFHGATGQWYAQPPDAPVRRAKGDLGNANIPNFESRSLTSPGAPYRLKR